MLNADFYREQAILEEARARLEANDKLRFAALSDARSHHADANFAEMIEIGTRCSPRNVPPFILA